MSDTTTQHEGPDDNPRTTVASVEDSDALLPAIGPREAFLIAYERLTLLGSVARRPAMIVAVVGGSGSLLDARLIEDRRSLIVGRHTQCALRLPDSAVSLRHLCALVRFEDKEPRLRLWDLNTGLHFTTEDGEQNAAVIAAGPVYAAVGGYALWFVPATGIPGVGWPARAEDAWKALPPRVFIDRRSPVPERKSEPWPELRDDEQTTEITRIAPPLLLRDDDEPEVAWGVLRLERDGHKQERGVSAERLEQGILVGRYERCGLLMSSENSEVSRVHLLLVRIGTEVWAIHTASTNGLYRGKVAIEAAVLADNDAISLGSGVTLRWHRAAHPEA